MQRSKILYADRHCVFCQFARAFHTPLVWQKGREAALICFQHEWLGYIRAKFGEFYYILAVEALSRVSRVQDRRSKGAFLSLTGRGEECAFWRFPGSDHVQSAATEILVYFPYDSLPNPHTFVKRDNISPFCI